MLNSPAPENSPDTFSSPQPTIPFSRDKTALPKRDNAALSYRKRRRKSFSSCGLCFFASKSIVSHNRVLRVHGPISGQLTRIMKRIICHPLTGRCIVRARPGLRPGPRVGSHPSNTLFAVDRSALPLQHLRSSRPGGLLPQASHRTGLVDRTSGSLGRYQSSNSRP